jgi:hypothetical protein
MQQANALNNVPRAAYWTLGEDRPLFIVVLNLLPSVGSKEDVKHVCFLQLGMLWMQLKRQREGCMLFPRKPTKGTIYI